MAKSITMRSCKLYLVFTLVVIWIIQLSAWANGPITLERLEGTVRAQLAESLPLIGADRVHRELGITGSGVEVLVIDDWSVGEGGLVHGQAVADVVQATAPGASLWLCKLDFSQTNAGDIASCLWEAVRRGLQIRVVNLSFAVGDQAFSRPCGSLEHPLAQAIRQLSRRGVIFVAASGNDGLRGALRFPACLPEVISVGATYDLSGFVEFDTEQVHCRDMAVVDRVACYSNVSHYLDLVAPGTIISTPSARDFGGTSAAAPLVSGSIALMLAADPSLDEQTILKTLQTTAVPAFDPASSQFYPRVDAYQAIVTILPKRPGALLTKVAQYDTNGNGLIDTSELLVAVQEWLDYQISDELFFAVLDAWVKQSPVRADDISLEKHALAGASAVELFDLSGRLIARLRGPSSGQLHALTRTLANGVYIYVAVFEDEGEISRLRGMLVVLR